MYYKELEDKYNKETKNLFIDFSRESQAVGHTKRTNMEYKNIGNYVLGLLYIHFENESILNLRKSAFRDLVLILNHDLNLSSSRMNSILSFITCCLEYAADHEEKYLAYNKNYAKNIKRQPKKLRKEKIFITREEVKKIINKSIAHWRLQDAVMISLLFDSGCRISELHQVKKSNLENQNFTNEIIRKGQKKKIKLIYTNETKELIKKWMDQRGEDKIESLFISPVLPTIKTVDKKKEVGVKTLADRISKMGSYINTPITPHVFRRSRAECLKRGEDERLNYHKFSAKEIQILLGHSQLSTTELYLKDDSVEMFENIINLMST